MKHWGEILNTLHCISVFPRDWTLNTSRDPRGPNAKPPKRSSIQEKSKPEQLLSHSVQLREYFSLFILFSFISSRLFSSGFCCCFFSLFIFLAVCSVATWIFIWLGLEADFPPLLRRSVWPLYPLCPYHAFCFFSYCFASQRRFELHHFIVFGILFFSSHSPTLAWTASPSNLLHQQCFLWFQLCVLVRRPQSPVNKPANKDPYSVLCLLTFSYLFPDKILFCSSPSSCTTEREPVSSLHARLDAGANRPSVGARSSCCVSSFVSSSISQ